MIKKAQRAFSAKHQRLFLSLDTPAKVQDFLNRIPQNFETDGKDTCKSPWMVMQTGTAHCIEGAMLGAYILSLHGHKPLLMHLKAANSDFDHVVALFQADGHFGALSKTNHAVLRYREPVYATIRELAMSYFHEYFTNDGIKTLRSYSEPLNLNTFVDDWMLEDGDVWGIDHELDKIKHYAIAPASVIKQYRKADPIERKIGLFTEWKK